MTAIQGIVSPIADPTTGVFVGPQWIAALDSLRPGKPLAIRGSISAGADGTVHIEAYKAGLNALQSAGHHVTLLLEENLWFKAGVNPNDVLAPLPNSVATANDWVDNYSLTVCQTLNALGEDCPDTVILGNEFNIVNPHLKPGDPIPPSKPEALSPEVAAAVTWLTGTRIQALCKQVKTIYPAAMSDLVSFNTSVTDGWIGGFVDEAMTYLTGLGLTAPWPWSGVTLNQEGNLTTLYENYIFYGLSHLKSEWGITGPTVLTEWGSGVPPLTPQAEAVVTSSFGVMANIAFAMYFFTAGLYKGYGTWSTQVIGNRFVPGSNTRWVALLQKLYQNTL